MLGGPLSPVTSFLRNLATGELTDLPDGQLLDRYLLRRDEAAFTAVLQRHGPMVWRICQYLLRDSHNTEDAFQAVFLVLARRAGELRRSPGLGPWLSAVAYRVAVRARSRVSRLRQREQTGADLTAAEAHPDAGPAELPQAVHEELQRLPEKYRVPMVLCYLEGLTNEEAARRLCCPVGTVKTRLHRARERLRMRLARRGVTVPAAVLATALVASPTSAAVPGALLDAASKSASSIVTGKSLADTASPGAITLMEGVLKTMSLNKVNYAVAILVALLVSGGVGWFSYRGLAGAPEQTGQEHIVKPDAQDSPKAAKNDSVEKPKRPADSAWSSASNGLRGRLVRYPSTREGGTEILHVGVELLNDSNDPVALSNDPAGLKLELRDAKGTLVETVSPPQSGAIPDPQWGVLPRHSYLGFGLYNYTIGILQDRPAFLAVLPENKTWSLKPGRYVLTGRYTVAKVHILPKDAWVGIVELPGLEIEVRESGTSPAP